MITGLDVAIARALSPLIINLIKGAGDPVKKSLSKWNAAGAASRLAGKLASADKIKTIWSPEKDTSLLSMYYPSKIFLNNFAISVNSLSDLPDENIVIEGIVGHGKSIFLRYLYLQELAGRGKGCLPLFIELRTLSLKRDLSGHLLDALDKIDVEPSLEVFDYLARSGNLVLLLDGFDELDDDLVKSTIESIEFLSEKFEKIRILVTARPSAEIQKSRLFKTISLQGLNAKDYKPFLEKLGVNSEKSLEITEAIRNSPSGVVDLIKTPLMMTLLLMVYESEKEIPSELPEFFDKLFSTMFTRHDRLKAGFIRKHHSGLSESQLQRFFEAFCFSVVQQGFGRSLTTDQFSKAFDKACGYSSESACEIEKFRRDIVKVACLMLEEGFDLTTFLHKSIAEYFSAAFVKKLSDESAEKFYGGIVRNYRSWEGVLTFLERIDQYRIAKYYWDPAFKSLFDKLSEFETLGKNRWVEFFVDAQPSFGVTYTLRSKREGETGLRPSSWGTYTHHYPIVGQIHSQITSAVMDGLKKAIPSSIDENILIEQSSIYVREERLDEDVGYKIFFKDAILEYGSSHTIEKFNELDNKLYRQHQSVRLTIAQEEARRAMIENDFFNY